MGIFAPEAVVAAAAAATAFYAALANGIYFCIWSITFYIYFGRNSPPPTPTIQYIHENTKCKII